VSSRVVEWPSQPGVAQLIMYQQQRIPSADDLERWVDIIASRGYTTIRTSALAAQAAAAVEVVGFAPVQDLALLQHDLMLRIDRPRLPVSKLTEHQHQLASDVDRAAFGDGWFLDPAAIDEVRHATPHHRARTVGGVPFGGYAVSGRDAGMGFLQRLAVHPSQQRQGFARALVLDSLRWMSRWRVERVLVNTPVNNEAALLLYESTGFHRLREHLRVYERSLQ
jgi:ribosomal protein S18 acetylase RimI-like enzyme